MFGDDVGFVMELRVAELGKYFSAGEAKRLRGADLDRNGIVTMREMEDVAAGKAASISKSQDNLEGLRNYATGNTRGYSDKELERYLPRGMKLIEAGKTKN